jgi:hypothetical protein
MAWKATGRPTVRRQRDKWVVRVDGIDTTTGKERPRQLGTFGSRRSAQAAATSLASRGELGGARGTVGQLVEEWAHEPAPRHGEGADAVRVGRLTHQA